MGAGRATAQVPPDPGRGRRARDGAGRPRGDARGASARVRRNPSPGRAPHGVKFPHPLVLLCGCVLVAAAASYVLPAGQFDRRHDAATGRDVVIAGTYHGVPPHRVTPFGALVAIPRGLADAAAVIFFVFLIGGAFTVVDGTGALRQGVDWLVRRVGNAETVVIPVVSLAFALGGVLDNMKEEIIALVSVVLLLARRLGSRPVVAVAMSLGAAAVGAAFSPVNPFQVGIAQQLAQLPLLSGSLFRIAFLTLALAIWIWGTTRYAARTRAAPTADAGAAVEGEPLDRRRGTVLPLALAAVAMMVVHAVVHIPVPSPSGHAVLTLPVLVPLADLLGLSRQVTVLAYQYGGGLCELLTPTNGALMAILAAAGGVRYEEWLRFALPRVLTLLALGAGAIGLGVAVGLQ